MTTLVRWIGLGSLVLWAGGCSPLSMAKHGLTEVRGASGKVVPVREATLAYYRSVGKLEIGTVTNTIAPVCPSSVQALTVAALREQAAKAKEKLPGSGVCTAEADITFYQPPGGVSALVGKGAILLGRAKLYDEQHQLQADLLVGVFSEAVTTGEDQLTAAFGKTLIEHVSKAGR
jgi:hypothetical protein